MNKWTLILFSIVSVYSFISLVYILIANGGIDMSLVGLFAGSTGLAYYNYTKLNK
ncbi:MULTISPECIES: hypothetical protein [Bacillaceae]|uniref:Uncharacterized protein n=1 Tax=Evansella alkalicola TaxID=745819 RepID=A0ABS6JV24_9BACI|nr:MULTISPECIES: hypothetical protein [Bacillaceae]MBU9722424.1 hypothetical protein [Bacillus alkalicola]